MKLLFLDCGMGIAGDMFMAALFELLTEEKQTAFLEKMNTLGLPGVELYPEKLAHCGILGTHMKVTVKGQEEESHDEHEHDHHHHHHSHTSMEDIRVQIGKMPLSEQVKADAIAVYEKIADAESHAHGVDVSEIHFHEVGTLDAIADIVGVCLLIEMLAPDRVAATPVHTGFGRVRCAHGILPVPAPATAYLLRGVPASAGTVEGELCTPTGAALLTHFVSEYKEMPLMRTEQIGYGMGKKEFPVANCVRSFYGTVEDSDGTVAELNCNLDDMTPEAIGYAMEILLEQGALDVFTVPIGMKKCRPGVLLVCICRESDAKRMAELMLTHTTTLGVREKICRRCTLERTIKTVKTSYGEVRVKTSVLPDHTERRKPEYDDVAAIARKTGKPFAEIVRDIAGEINEGM